MNKFFKFNEYVELGKCFKECEAYLIALENFNKAIEISSFVPINTDHLVEAYDLRANTKMFLDMYVETICDYSKAIELDPKESYLYFFRGIAYESLGQNIEALINLKISMILNPDNSLAESIIDYLENEKYR